MALEVSEAFLSLVITAGIGLLLSLARLIYKSKCKNIECCGGLIRVERDINAEIELDEREPPRSGEEGESPRRV